MNDLKKVVTRSQKPDGQHLSRPGLKNLEEPE